MTSKQDHKDGQSQNSRFEVKHKQKCENAAKNSRNYGGNSPT